MVTTSLETEMQAFCKFYSCQFNLEDALNAIAISLEYSDSDEAQSTVSFLNSNFPLLYQMYATRNNGAYI